MEWALPRFLQEPPTPQDTATFEAQVRELAGWASAQLREAGWAEPTYRPAIADWEKAQILIDQTFLAGTALHSLSDEGLVSAKTAFTNALQRREAGAAASRELAGRALSAMQGAIAGTACRPPCAPLPPALRQLRADMDAALGREFEEEDKRALARFTESALKAELADELLDLDGWAALWAASSLAVPRGETASAWSSRMEVTVGQRAVVPVWVSRDQAGAVQCKTQGSVAGRSPQRRWLNADISLTDRDLTYISGSLNLAVQCPLATVPAPDAAVTHFTDQQWGQCLAGEAKAAQAFWQAAGEYVFPSQPNAPKTGATDLPQAIGVLPFCATPQVARLARDRTDEPVRLLSTTGETVGTLRAEGRVVKGGLSYPPILVLELEPRTVPAATTMMASHGPGAKPTEERWTAQIPAPIRKVVFTLGSPSPGIVFPETVEAQDEKGQVLCRLEVSDFKLQ